MDSLQSCLILIELHCFMASIYMKDAYHSVLFHPDYTKYLKFTINERLYTHPRIFTKLTKPIVSHLHEKGSLYIDNLFIRESSFDECHQNACTLLNLGFNISSKSQKI